MAKLRGLYTVVSVLALLHLLGLAGFGAFMWNNGTLNAERVELLAGVLRGEYDAPAEDGGEDAGEETVVSRNSEETIAREQIDAEIAKRQLEREKTEMRQRLDLIAREMHRVRQEREFFEDQRRRATEAAKRRNEQDYRDGFQKQLEYFGQLKPKNAVEYLLSRNVEEAAEILRTIDTRKGKKIIEAAKTPNQRKKMDEILRLLPELQTEG